MKLLILYIIGIILCKSPVKAFKSTSTLSSTRFLDVVNDVSHDVNKDSKDAGVDKLLDDVTKKEEQLLDDALFNGLMDGYTFTLDCVTMSKHEENHELVGGKKSAKEEAKLQKQIEKEHQQNVKEAKLEAEYMTKHRPLESAKVDKKEAVLFNDFNILMHYLNSRGQHWKLIEPKEMGFEESPENHMLFKSEHNDSTDIKIPENMFYSVGNMKKSLPMHKDNKKPILLTSMESFIVSRLAYLSMNKLIATKAPVEDRLEYLMRWIKIAKEHYVLFLPYVSITAPRCHDLLKGEDDKTVTSEYQSNDHYKHLLGVCNKMLDLRSNNPMLQTYVMLDSDLHPELMRKTLDDKHMFPLMLQERESQLKTIHQHHNHEMDWDEFQSSANMLLAGLEQQVLSKYHKFLEPSSWGIGLSVEDSKNAEMDLIKLFVKSQKKLNMKVIQTVRKVAHELVHTSKKDEKELKKSMIKFSEKEQEAAKRDRSKDKILDQCIKDAEMKLDEDLKHYNASSISDIANKLKDFEHDSWMECASSRIFDKFTHICKEHEDYCRTLMDALYKQLKDVDPDSTAAIALENCHYVLTTALLKNDKLNMEDVKKYVLQVSKEEIKDMSEPVNNHPTSISNNSTTPSSSEESEPSSDSKKEESTETKDTSSKDNTSNTGEHTSGETSGNEASSESTDESKRSTQSSTSS